MLSYVVFSFFVKGISVPFGEFSVSSNGSLASCNERFFVSGAQAIDTIKPTSRMAAIPAIEALNPNELKEKGSRNVPIAEPIRLIAVTIPIPEPRISVGKSSAGYTSVRFDAADMKKVKIKKATNIKN
jgi:hypothetical protein